jgi:2-polyprenyl-3-methyl-5-hydroxy-6-metoxy-1,4-benzoquinol methylase
MTFRYIKKHCLFCKDKENIIELYPQTFTDKDLTPEVFSARRTMDNLHYKIVRCKNCGLVFSQEILPPEALENLYSKSKITYGEYTDIIRKDYWQGLERFLGDTPKEKALEIGCGNGFFLEELLKHGFKEVYGCEPSTDAKNMANPTVKDNIVSGFFKEDLFAQNTFDLVCSFQTLDHLSDPEEIIKSCHGVLKPNGLAYFITHDINSLQAKTLRDRSPIIDVEHIYLFNRDTLRRLFEGKGFKVIKVFGLKNTYPLSYWLKMLRLEILNNIIKISGLGSFGLSLAAGNIAIIARNKK